MKGAATRRAAALLTVAGVGAGCGSAPPETPAALCARAAGIYMGLQLPLEIDSETIPELGSVTVRYRGFDRANIPAEGEATCFFSDGAEPSSGLASATVGGAPLGRHEIAALNRKLAAP